MKLFTKMRDGGPESPVIGYFLVEIKSLFSIVLLHFTGTREAYHSHAFNAWTLWLKGLVHEEFVDGKGRPWTAGQWKYTPRNCMHRVEPMEDSWAISFRGPWSMTWREYVDEQNKIITLTHGRKIVGIETPIVK